MGKKILLVDQKEEINHDSRVPSLFFDKELVGPLFGVFDEAYVISFVFGEIALD